MTQRTEGWPIGTPAWVGLTASDIGAATGFYGDLLGWRFVEGLTPDGRPFVWATRDGRRVAGIVQAATPGVRAQWAVYLSSPDVETVVDRAGDAGGHATMGPLRVNDGGAVLGFVRDPTGADTGLWQGSADVGFELTGTAGAVLGVELRTDDPVAARRFYGAVLGLGDTAAGADTDAPAWPPAAPTGLPCRVVRLGDDPDPVDAPHWLPWFAVTDLAAAMRVAVTHGGTPGAPTDGPHGPSSVVRGPEGEAAGLTELRAGTDPGEGL